MPKRDPSWKPAPLLQATVGLHLGALGWGIWRPGSWRTLLGLLIANHAAIGVACMLPRSRLLGPNVTRFDVDEAVFLTFDDGPDPDRTPKVLEELDRANAKASFFCIGARAQQHPEIVREIVERGHTVENHTWSHRHSFAFSRYSRVAREVDRAQELLSDLTGRAPEWFRAPAGMRNPYLHPVLEKRGIGFISWTRRGLDAVDPDAGRVAGRLLRNLRGGDVLLLHDGPPAVSSHEGTVLQVLPEVLAEAAATGLEVRALPSPGREPF